MHINMCFQIIKNVCIFIAVMSTTISEWNRRSVRLYHHSFVGELMSYWSYVYLFTYSWCSTRLYSTSSVAGVLCQTMYIGSSLVCFYLVGIRVALSFRFPCALLVYSFIYLFIFLVLFLYSFCVLCLMLTGPEWIHELGRWI